MNLLTNKDEIYLVNIQLFTVNIFVYGRLQICDDMRTPFAYMLK